MPGIDDLTAGGPAGVRPSIFGVGAPALLDPFTKGNTVGLPKTSTPTDDFSAANPGLWAGSGLNANVTLTGVSPFRLQIACVAAYESYSTAAVYSLTSSTVAIEAPVVPNLGNGTTEAFLLVTDNISAGSNRVQIGYSGGFLTFNEQIAGVQDVTSIAYDAVAHQWWRIGELSGTLTWETSPDSITWTVQRTKATAFNWGAVGIILQSGFYGTEPTPGVAQFDYLNLQPTVFYPKPALLVPAPVNRGAFTPQPIYLRSTSEPVLVEAMPHLVMAGVATLPQRAPLPVWLRSTADVAAALDAPPRQLVATVQLPRLAVAPITVRLDGDPTAPDLSTVPGIGLWLDAASIGGTTPDGGTVSSWLDQSGNGLTVTQGTGGSQPTWAASVATLNSKPAVRFNGGHFLANAASMATAGEWTAFVVTRQTAAANAWALFDGNGNGFALGIDVTAAKRELLLRGQADVIGSNYTTSTPEIWTGERAAGTSTLYVNGAVDATSTANYTDASGGLTIGAFEGGTGSFFTGDIAEVIAFPRALTAYERAVVHTYLADKYFLTVADRAALYPEPTALTTSVVRQVPPATPVPVVIRSTADPVVVADALPRVSVARVVAPLAAARAFVSRMLTDADRLPPTSSPVVIRAATAAAVAPQVVLTRSTAEIAATNDTPTRALVVQVLAPIAAARAFVSTLLADQPTPSTAAPAPVVARVTTPTALPAPVLLRPTADPVATVGTLPVVLSGRAAPAPPPAAPAPTSTRSTADPVAAVEQLPRLLVVPVTTAPAVAPRAAVWAPLAELVGQPVPFAPVSVAAASRQWAPVPVVVRPVTDPAAPDAPPRLVVVTAPAALTTTPRPTWTRPAAALADALARPVVIRVGAATITVRVVLARSTYGDPPAARPGRITAGIRRTPTIDAGQTTNAALDAGVTRTSTADAGLTPGPGLTAGIRRNPSIDGS